MASPQKENGYTAIANEIVEIIYSAPLSGSELRVLLLIFRKTYGWHKKEDEISLSQIVTETKLSRKQVCEVTRKLVTKRLLFKNRKHSNEYTFNKNYDDWVVTDRLLGSYQKVTRGSYRTVTRGSYRTVNPLVTEMEHTKETITKETIKENNVVTLGTKVPDKRNKDLQEIIDFSKSKNFSLQGSTKQNRQYAYNLIRKKDNNGTVLGVERVKWLIEAAIDSRNKQYAPQISDFKSLFYKWQDLINFLGKEKNARGKKVIG